MADGGKDDVATVPAGEVPANALWPFFCAKEAKVIRHAKSLILHLFLSGSVCLVGIWRHVETLVKKMESAIMTPEEVAKYLRKSISWVYKNRQALGGRKLKGSLFFPKKEDLYERLFHQGERVEIRLHPKKIQANRSLVQNKNRGQAGRVQKKGGDFKSQGREGDPNRHGILGACQ